MDADLWLAEAVGESGSPRENFALSSNEKITAYTSEPDTSW